LRTPTLEAILKVRTVVTKAITDFREGSFRLHVLIFALPN